MCPNRWNDNVARMKNLLLVADEDEWVGIGEHDNGNIEILTGNKAEAVVMKRSACIGSELWLTLQHLRFSMLQ